MSDEMKKKKVFSVFQNIADQYDDANIRISLGMQNKWKKSTVNYVLRQAEFGSKVLDVCCGTGDLAIAVAKQRKDLTVEGIDFSTSMLCRAEEKGRTIENVSFRRGDAMHLPYEDHEFSVACISFGLRNTEDYARVIGEMVRVIKPGGMVFCLESMIPENRFVLPFYKLYFRFIMPLIGGGLKHYKDYLWLYDSTKNFLDKKKLQKLFIKEGLVQIKSKSWLFGACVLLIGNKNQEE